MAGAGNLEAHLAAAGGGIVGAPDWGLGLAPEVASLLAVSASASALLQRHQAVWVPAPVVRCVSFADPLASGGCRQQTR